MVRRHCVPQLPFLISGLESSLHRRLFYHFTHVMSRVLTTSGNDSNPMNSIVTPLALADQTLMQTLLSLSCSHLLKLQPTGLNPELSAEKQTLHQKAAQFQIQRVQALRGPTANATSHSSIQIMTRFSQLLFYSVSMRYVRARAIMAGESIFKWHESYSMSPPQQQQILSFSNLFFTTTRSLWSPCLLWHDISIVLLLFQI